MASSEHDFASYVVPARIRTRVAVVDDTVEVRRAVAAGPLTPTRVLYRLPLHNVEGVRVEQVLEPRWASAAGVLALAGLAASILAVRTGAILTAVVVAVAALLAAGLAGMAAARTRLVIDTRRGPKAWFDVASTEEERAVAFAGFLVDAARSAGRVDAGR